MFHQFFSIQINVKQIEPYEIITNNILILKQNKSDMPTI